MSSRPTGYYNSRGGGYRDRDAEAGPANKRRSRSPDDREQAYKSRDSDRSRYQDGDRERDRDSSYRRRQEDVDHRGSNYRRDVKEKGRSRSPESTHAAQPQTRDRPHQPRDGPARQPIPADPSKALAAGAQRYSGPGAVGGPAGYQRYEQNRPLDRRAIEEGRRQREMERAVRVQKELEGRDASRSVTRSPEPYRRQRNANGSHVNPDGGEEGEDGEGDEEDDAEAAAMAAMGFGGFGSTKGKHREGNAEGGANIKKERTWRQYMNRRGGFNRPLDPVKEKKKK
ncbi:hypothetical protein QFC19_002482 [Naganishia cerealis]|uniref:Uncharacterized protein n=1 Tax=Naganishia cerealis TaxID=610337 RepID=A0ACC2W8Z8_9TREE|nr:hypothetical protein QFC19_002482 [Naganishia cerealis]